MKLLYILTHPTVHECGITVAEPSWYDVSDDFSFTIKIYKFDHTSLKFKFDKL